MMAMSTDAGWGRHFCVEPGIFVSNRAFFVSNHAFCCRTRLFLCRTSVIMLVHIHIHKYIQRSCPKIKYCIVILSALWCFCKDNKYFRHYKKKPWYYLFANGPRCSYDHYATTVGLTNWNRDKMAAIFQTTFSNSYFSMKVYEFRLWFDWLKFVPKILN